VSYSSNTPWISSISSFSNRRSAVNPLPSPQRLLPTRPFSPSSTQVRSWCQAAPVMSCR
jgi:hypothetical protein